MFKSVMQQLVGCFFQGIEKISICNHGVGLNFMIKDWKFSR